MSASAVAKLRAIRAQHEGTRGDYPADASTLLIEDVRALVDMFDDMERVLVADATSPRAELLKQQMNEAPEPLRTWIFDVETTCPEASEHLRKRELEDTNAGLQALVAELQRALEVLKTPSDNDRRQFIRQQAMAMAAEDSGVMLYVALTQQVPLSELLDAAGVEGGSLTYWESAKGVWAAKPEDC